MIYFLVSKEKKKKEPDKLLLFLDINLKESFKSTLLPLFGQHGFANINYMDGTVLYIFLTICVQIKHYLIRHPEINQACTQNNQTQYLTTENSEMFNKLASLFLGEEISSLEIELF